MSVTPGTTKIKKVCELKIINYKNYLDFLNDFVEQKKKENVRWSYRVWARQLGITDPSVIRKAVVGNRVPNLELIGKLATYFSFTREEFEYFSILIELSKVKLDEEKKERIAESFKTNIRLAHHHKASERDYGVPEDSTWIHSLLLSYAYQNKGLSLESIKKHTQVAISDEEILDGINDLIGYGLLSFNDEGKLVPEESNGVMVMRDETRDDTSYMLLNKKITKTFLEALEKNIYGESKDKEYFSKNIIFNIPKKEVENFHNDLKGKVIELLVKYDQMEMGDDYYLYNIFTGSYPVFHFSKDEKSATERAQSTL